MKESSDAGHEVLSNLLRHFDASYGLGTMSCNVYDTAWVAYIFKTVNNRSQWLFPSSFYWVFDRQNPDGGWNAHPDGRSSTPSDSILSTMAALYCLLRHKEQALQLRLDRGTPLDVRIQDARISLSNMLHAWHIEQADAVGFEVLAPSLLELLAQHEIEIDFPGKPELLAIRDAKLAKIRPDLLYEHAPVALLHSLEAFHGRADFNFKRIAQHKVGGSIMGSPAATASYLIRQKDDWDEEAEAYLRLVLSNGGGKGCGSVLSAFPSTVFERVWARAYSPIQIMLSFADLLIRVKGCLNTSGIGRFECLLSHTGVGSCPPNLGLRPRLAGWIARIW